MSWKFNPPPGWPAQPEGWAPPPGWVPDPSWPPPPAGWQFWVPAGSAPTSAPPQDAVPPAAVPPAAPPPAAPPPSGAPGFSSGPPPQFASGAPPFSAGPPVPSGPPTPFGAPGLPPYGAPAKRTRAWFGRWWGILGLIAVLLLGAAAGYAATRAALNASDDSDTNATGELEPTASESPIATDPATESPGVEPTGLPSLPPAGSVSLACSDVAVIMLTMAVAPIEEEDPDAYVDTLIESRRTAADELREVEGADADEQAAIDALADEVDAAAQMVEDDPDNAATVQSSFDRVSEAYDTFNADRCI